MAASEVPAGTTLVALNGESRTIEEWLITFQLLAVVLDPYTYESSWLLDTAGRILENFRGASVRICFIVTCSAEDARGFLGPWADSTLTYVDPERSFVRALGVDELPALVHIHQSRRVAAVAQGWQPEEWRDLLAVVAAERHWSRPVLPAPGDPAPYRGTPALT